MQKRWFRFLTALVLCAMTVLLPGVTASAENGGQTLAISVSLVDHQGHKRHRLANGTVWAVISLTGYTSDLEAATVILDLGSKAVELGSPTRCLTPYEGAKAFVGADGKILSVMMAGSVSKQQLDDNGGEICRVELTRTGDTNEDAVLRVLERSGMVFTGVSLAGDSTATPELGSYEYLVGVGSDPSVTPLNGVNILTADSMTFYKDTLRMTGCLPGNIQYSSPGGTRDEYYGDPKWDGMAWHIGTSNLEGNTVTTMTTKEQYDLSLGFTLTFQATADGLSGNFTYEDRDGLFIDIGDYRFVLKGFVTPQILFDGKQIDKKLTDEDRDPQAAKWTVKDLDLEAYLSEKYKNDAFSKNKYYDPTKGDEKAASDYNALKGWEKATIETNIKNKWKSVRSSFAVEGTTLSRVKYTIQYDGEALIFTKESSASSSEPLTKQFQFSASDVSNRSLENTAITFGTQGSAGTRIKVANAKLTATGKNYSISTESNCANGTAGTWSNGKEIPAAHSFEYVAEHVAERGSNRLYRCTECGTYSYEQGTTAMTQIPLSDCTVTLDNDVMQKTGAALTPEVTVSFGKGTLTTVLTKDIDYTVSYSNNTQAGTATVTVTAAENGLVSGSTTVNFTIVLAGDVNSDGKVDAADYVLLKSHVKNGTKPSGAQFVAADMDNDKNVDKDDADKLWNKLLRIQEAEQE